MLCLSISHIRRCVMRFPCLVLDHDDTVVKQHGCHPFSVLSGLSGSRCAPAFRIRWTTISGKISDPGIIPLFKDELGFTDGGAGGGISVLAELGRDAGAGSVSGDARNSGAVQGPWRQDRRRLPFRQRRDPPRLPRKRPAGAGSDLRLGASARAPQAARLAAGANHGRSSNSRRISC